MSSLTVRPSTGNRGAPLGGPVPSPKNRHARGPRRRRDVAALLESAWLPTVLRGEVGRETWEEQRGRFAYLAALLCLSRPHAASLSAMSLTRRCLTSASSTRISTARSVPAATVPSCTSLLRIE